MDFSYDVVVLVILLISVISQNVFGVGVLLWGTPLLLLFGFNFTDVLFILLPSSMILSVLQVIGCRPLIEKKLLIKSLLISLPIFFITLYSVIYFNFSIVPFVSAVMLIAALSRFKLNSGFQRVLKKRKDFMIPLIGLVHGLSNLGGFLLVFWVTLSVNGKLATRTNVAINYFFLASVQLMTLNLASNSFILHPLYIIFTVLVHTVCDLFVFRKLDEETYYNLFTALMVIMSLMLCTKYLFY